MVKIVTKGDIMDFNEYQKQAKTTLIKKNQPKELLIARLVLGLCGESGEVAEKVKKYLRDTSLDAVDIYALSEALYKELGDVLWYISNLADILGIDLNRIAKENIKKLASRKERGKIKGSGDLR